MKSIWTEIMKRKFTFFGVMLLLLSVSVFILAAAGRSERAGRAGPTANISAPKEVKLGKLPKDAEIIYHSDRHIHTMDRNGGNVTQITFGKYRNYEHVAVSPRRRYIVANEQLPNPAGKAGGISRLWLFDLQKSTESRLLPRFDTVGNGGVAWDNHGFIYFAGKEKDVVSKPQTVSDFIKNAGANDVYKIKPDGTGLKRLINTSDRGEADVAVSEDGTLVTFNGLALNPANDYTEIWMIRTDGTDPRLIYTGGVAFVDSVHDPEFSSDNTKVVFSKVNSKVPPNFPDNPIANTAHDLYSLQLDSKELRRLTVPGPVSIIPNLKGNMVLYTEINEKAKYAGASLIFLNRTDQTPKRIKFGANSPRWIPDQIKATANRNPQTSYKQ